MRRVGRRQDDCLGSELLDRAHQPLGVPGADGDVRQPESLEGAESGTGDEGPCVVGRDDALAGCDPEAA